MDGHTSKLELSCWRVDHWDNINDTNMPVIRLTIISQDKSIPWTLSCSLSDWFFLRGWGDASPPTGSPGDRCNNFKENHILSLTLLGIQFLHHTNYFLLTSLINFRKMCNTWSMIILLIRQQNTEYVHMSSLAKFGLR